MGEPGPAENDNNHKQIISSYYIFIYYHIYLKPEGEGQNQLKIIIVRDHIILIYHDYHINIDAHYLASYY